MARPLRLGQLLQFLEALRLLTIFTAVPTCGTGFKEIASGQGAKGRPAERFDRIPWLWIRIIAACGNKQQSRQHTCWAGALHPRSRGLTISPARVSRIPLTISSSSGNARRLPSLSQKAWMKL